MSLVATGSNPNKATFRIDSTYLEQVENVEASCPSCDQVIDTSDD